MPEAKRKPIRWATTLVGVLASSLSGVLLVRRVLPQPAPPDASGRGAVTAPVSAEAVAAGYETDQANAGVLVQVIAGWGVLVVGLIFGMVFLQRYLAARQAAAEPGFTSQETALLSNYAWADPDHAHARIPIGRAIELTVGKTLDTVP